MRKFSFIILAAVLVFAAASCEKETENRGNPGTTDTTGPIDTIGSIDTIVPPDTTVTPPDTTTFSLSGTTWMCHLITDLPQINHHDELEIYWDFKSDSNITISMIIVEWEGTVINYPFEDTLSTTYFFDGENGFYISPESNVPFRYDSKTETIRIDEDIPEYTRIFYRVE